MKTRFLVLAMGWLLRGLVGCGRGGSAEEPSGFVAVGELGQLAICRTPNSRKASGRQQDGVLTATEDQCIWTKKQYDNFILDLEFKTADGTNSGVIVHCSDMKDWIPNSVEIQIADDFSEKWGKSPKTWQCAAIFGRLAAKPSPP